MSKKSNRLKKKSIGKIEHGKTDCIDFYHGLLNVGEIQAIPVIKELNKKINNKKDVIIDAPPGTSCPVIESIKDSDYCILVTEPTPFGLHDLKLAVDLVRHLKINFGIIINRDGIGDNKVDLFCKKQNIPIIMRISESKKIANLYSKGIAITSESDKWKNSFKSLFEKIKKEVKQ